ncbi:MAG: exodeoxyribonuclease III [Verrucomicrobiae bacterium]|nr:exodeoxyribonuclease III [Verrucomicrobiae bacterium]
MPNNKTYLSWNVNGLRAVLNKGFADWFETSEPDVLCLQEIKAEEHQVEYAFPGYHQYWNSAVKKGYSGTLIVSKTKPMSVTYGLGMEEHDQEGRIITAEYRDHFLVNVYTPNSQNELRRLDYRTQIWDRLFLEYLKQLEQTKPVITCGDFNVAHKEIDLKNPKTNTKNAGFTPEERAAFDNYIQAGFIDTFREFNQEPDQYSWWSYRMAARERNVGWRIDYFLISRALRKKLKHAFILPDVMGSDHCPVGIELG